MIARIAVRLCGPSGPVVLFREGRLAKLREELVEALQGNRLRRGDLDAQRSARRGVIDNEQPIRRSHGPRALLPGWVREVQVRRKCPALAQSAVRRHRGRARLRRPRETWRLRITDFRGLVLPLAVGAVGSRGDHDSTAAGAPGLTITRLRSLRLLRTWAHGLPALLRGFAATAGNLRLAWVNRSAWLDAPTLDENARGLACQP
jgi:hypothetical protein